MGSFYKPKCRTQAHLPALHPGSCPSTRQIGDTPHTTAPQQGSSAGEVVRVGDDFCDIKRQALRKGSAATKRNSTTRMGHTTSLERSQGKMMTWNIQLIWPHFPACLLGWPHSFQGASAAGFSSTISMGPRAPLGTFDPLVLLCLNKEGAGGKGGEEKRKAAVACGLLCRQQSLDPEAGTSHSPEWW